MSVHFHFPWLIAHTHSFNIYRVCVTHMLDAGEKRDIDNK